MRRFAFVTIIACACALALASFALAGCAAPEPPHSEEAPLAVSDNTEIGRKVVCWGDSLTYGTGASEAFIMTTDDFYDASNQSYPAILAHFTHLPTFSFGFPGATSLEIMQMYLGTGTVGISALFRPFTSNDEPNSIARAGDVLVIEMGSNGGWEDYDELIDQYRAIIEYGGCTDYIVLGDTDDPGTSFADVDQWQFFYGSGEQETMWEQALREEFGDHFLNLRAWLVENGLEVAGLEPTYEDYDAAQMGRISPQLRADETHLNSYGYYAQARAVYEHGAMLGYWE